jgi:hypothetical protein
VYRIAFLLILLIAFCGLLAAQPVGLMSVIRTGGTNMHAQPTEKSPKLSQLSYADKVILIQDFASGIVEKDNSIGYWVKVRFNQSVGYIFRNDLTRQIETKVSTGDVALVVLQSGPLAEVTYNPNLNYVAVIKEGSTQRLEKVELDFRIHVDPEGKEQVTTECSAIGDILFIYGSSRKQRSKWFEFYNLSEGQKTLYGKNDSVPKTIRLIDNRVSLYTELKWAPKTEKELSYAVLMVKEEVDHKRIQKLFPDGDYSPMDQYQYPIYVVWCGDLDGDKRADFLISFGDVLKHYDLYLSGNSAGKHNVLEKVATWNAAMRL